MSERERNLAIILGTLLMLGIGAAAYFLIVQPLQAGKAQQAALEKDVGELKLQVEKMRAIVPKLNEAKRRSLPADPKPVVRAGQSATPTAAAAATRPGASTAKLEYSLLLTRLLAKAKIPQTSISIKERVMDARGIPVLPNTKRPAYTRYAYDIEVRNIDMWEVHDFLLAYYQVDLLHQITSFTLKRDENAGAGRRSTDRKDLTLSITTEAIMIDGVESRPSLVPVPSAFAAVGGWAGYDSIAFNPNPAAGRLINPFRAHPVLAYRELPNRTRAVRDYSYIVYWDMFHGRLPAPPSPAFDRVSDITVKLGEPISPVKLSIGGVLPPGPITWDVKFDGNPKLLPPGSVRLDAAKQLPSAALSVKPAEGESGYATINITATIPPANPDEKSTQLKTSLRVTVTPPSPKDEISAYIFLVNTTVRSDGSASAMIRDRYNPFDYEVRANPTGVKVQKYWYLTATQRKEDGPTTPQLIISDENVTATNRVLKVVAVDDDGLIVIDVTPPVTKPGGVIGIPIGPAGAGGNKLGGGPPQGGFPGGPGGGKGFGPGGVAKMAEPPAFIPLSGAVGTASALIPPTAQPKLYRWSLGQSLKQITEVPKSEADRILLKAGQVGPVGATARDPVVVAPSAPMNPVAPMPPPMVPPAAPNVPVAAPSPQVAPEPREVPAVEGATLPEAPAPRPVRN